MENIYTIASSSSSTTYGNVMSVFKEMLVRKLSVNYFKDVFMASEIAYTNIRRRLGRNSLDEISKLERPYMTITPQIQPPSGDMFLYDIPLTKNFDNIEYGVEKNTLFPIIKNDRDGYTLNYKLNRDQIQFEIAITVDTYIQQLDLYKYLVNHLTWERPYTESSSLEAMIPREMISYMGKLSNINIDDDTCNQIPAIMHCLNKYSGYPITYKMRNGTGLDEFFMYYQTQILYTFTDLNLDNVSRRGMADDYYQLSFHANVEFNLPGLFALTGNKKRESSVIPTNSTDSSHSLIPFYTINNLYSNVVLEENGFVLYTSTRFKTDTGNENNEDSLNIKVLFDDNYLTIIRKYYTNNIPMDTIISLKLIKNDDVLEENFGFRMNWNSMDLIISNPDTNATYCLLIYTNNTIFNEEILDTIEESANDKSRI